MPDADHRRLRVVRDRVLVQRDPRGVAARLGLGAGDADALQVDERQVGVGAAGDRAHALGGEPGGERLGVGDDLARVRLVRRRARPPCSATALAATACMSGPPCINGKTALSIAAACSALHRIMPPRGPRSTLCVVNETTSAYGTGLRDRLAGHQADEVRGVDHEDRRRPRRRSSRNAAKSMSRGYAVAPQMIIFGRCSQRQVAHLVVVDELGVLA